MGKIEEQKEINITYETLFEILKREKDMADLQKLDATFFLDFVKYLQEKEEILTKEGSVFSYDEKKKTEKQIENARRIIKDIYDRREKKIMNFALIKSRTKTDIMDMSTFLASEKKMFDEAVKVLSAFRDTVANNLIVGREPLMPDVSVSENNSQVAQNQTGHSQTTTQENKDTSENKSTETQLENNETENKENQNTETNSQPIENPQVNENQTQTNNDQSDNSTKLVRFLYAVPKFVGPELEEYGPFEEEDIANLPAPIADLLLGKEKVEEIQS